MKDRREPGGAEEWRNGWRLLLAAFFGVGVCGMLNSALSVLIKPLSETFGWTRAEISLAPAILSTGILLLSPAIGALVDRFGARRVALTGIPCCALVFSAFSLTNGSLALFYLFFALAAVTVPAVGPLSWSLGVATHFRINRGLALGIASAGIASFQTITPILTQLAFEELGIHLLWIALGAYSFLIGFPLAYLYFHDASPRGSSGSTHPEQSAAGSDAGSQGGMTLFEALASARLWRLGAAFAITAGVCGFFSLHLVAILTDRGIAPREAALVYGAMAPSIVAGRILGGVLLDRLSAPHVAAFMLILPLAACALILTPVSGMAAGIVIALLVGFALGSEGDTIAFMTAGYFGLRSFGKIYGLLYGIYGFGFGAGSFLGGMIFERTGSYAGVSVIFIVALLIAMILLLTMGRYTSFEPKVPAPAA